MARSGGLLERSGLCVPADRTVQLSGALGDENRFLWRGAEVASLEAGDGNGQIGGGEYG